MTINQNFCPVPQIYTQNTTISTKKDFWKFFPVFQKNLHCVQNFDKNGFALILKCYPLFIWQSIKVSVLFHKSRHEALPFWQKRISGKFPNFPEKLTLCAKFEQKWFCWDFEVLPNDYVTINQNFSPIPQIYTQNSTISSEKDFWKFSQFSRKTYIVCKIGTKIVLQGFWSVTPWLCDNPSNLSPNPHIYILTTTILTKKIFWKISQFSRKTYIVCKILRKMVLPYFQSVTPC